MKKKYSNVNKKIAHEFAIGIIVLLAVAVGAMALTSAKRQIREISSLQEADIEKAAESAKNIKRNQKKIPEECQSHYYEGETEIRGWAPSDMQDGEGMIVRIDARDIKNLPIKDPSVFSDLTVRMIDPTAALEEKLTKATKEKPASFTVKGYAEICEKKPPQVSLGQASVAFKKS